MFYIQRLHNSDKFEQSFKIAQENACYHCASRFFCVCVCSVEVIQHKKIVWIKIEVI